MDRVTRTLRWLALAMVFGATASVVCAFVLSGTLRAAAVAVAIFGLGGTAYAMWLARGVERRQRP
jgi:hypothetical protein